MEKANVISEIRNTADMLMGWMFWCPGCQEFHAFGADRWQKSGDLIRPTFAPSLMLYKGSINQCHLSVKDGMIRYHTDCRHELAGQIVPMEPVDES